MAKILYPVKLPALCLLAVFIAGCTFSLPDSLPEREKVESLPVGEISPEIDYSAESPDCVTAAQRIEDSVVIGMALSDVRRLVGQPKTVLPGSWWWTSGFSIGGRPVVRFGFSGVEHGSVVSSFSIDRSDCPG